jgi:hypothetical protein
MFMLVICLSLGGTAVAFASGATDFVNPRGTAASPAGLGEIEDIVFNHSGDPLTHFKLVYQNAATGQIIHSTGLIATVQGGGYVLYDVPTAEYNQLPLGTTIKLTVQTYAYQAATGSYTYLDDAVTYIVKQP